MLCMRTKFTFLGDISEYQGVLHLKELDFEEFFHEIMEALLSESFLRERKCLADPMAVCCMVNCG